MPAGRRPHAVVPRRRRHGSEPGPQREDVGDGVERSPFEPPARSRAGAGAASGSCPWRSARTGGPARVGEALERRRHVVAVSTPAGGTNTSPLRSRPREQRSTGRVGDHPIDGLVTMEEAEERGAVCSALSTRNFSSPMARRRRPRPRRHRRAAASRRPLPLDHPLREGLRAYRPGVLDTYRCCDRGGTRRRWPGRCGRPCCTGSGRARDPGDERRVDRGGEVERDRLERAAVGREVVEAQHGDTAPALRPAVRRGEDKMTWQAVAVTPATPRRGGRRECRGRDGARGVPAVALLGDRDGHHLRGRADSAARTPAGCGRGMDDVADGADHAVLGVSPSIRQRVEASWGPRRAGTSS